MKTVTINLYSFNELNENARKKAIEEHYCFMVSLPPEYEDENGEMKTEENYDPSNEEVIDNIELNDYLFYRDGNVACCTTFTDKHPRAGETILQIGSEEYKVN